MPCPLPFRRPLAGLLVVFAGLAACDRPDEDAIVAPSDETTPPPQAETSDPPAPESIEHELSPGQTLWDLARTYQVSLGDLMEANGLSPDDVRKLRPGRVLTIPGATERKEVLSERERTERERANLPEPEGGAYHFLAEGETLWDVARMYERSVDDIMAKNGFTDSDARALRPGKPVLIPGLAKSAVKASEPRTRQTFTHTLAPGETVWVLANNYQVSVAEIMSANGLSAEQVTTLRDGTKIVIPGVARDTSGRMRRETTGAQKKSIVSARALGVGTPQVARKLLAGQVDTRWLRAAGDPKRLPGTLRWPVSNGWFTRGFGSGTGGYHQAVDIMGEVGWNVRAAAPGIVAYSGNEVRGYGNMVIVIHPGGWVTMYAHNSVNFVVAGERVARGAILAEVGSTGISRGPHVHFELIHRGQNCDPAPLFRPGVRHRSGKSAPIAAVTWVDPEIRPRAIRCERRRRHPNSRYVANEDPESSQ